jgi:hypothetical protein
MYDASKDSEHLVVCFQSLFKFQVFVPERMSKEVKSNTTCAALEKPVPAAVSMRYTLKGVWERKGGGWRKANMAYACACDAVCSSASNDNSKTSIEYNAKAVEVGSCEGKERLNIQCEK